MTEDDEIEVEAVDNSYAEEEVELRIRGMRGLILQFGNLVQRGVVSTQPDHGGMVADVYIGNAVLKQFDRQVDYDKIPTGMIEFSEEDFHDAVDVEIVALEEDE